MIVESGLEKIKDQVESSYPTPVAAVFRRCRVTSKQDLGGRHKNIVDLFEAFTKFLCIVQLQEARQSVPNLKDRLPQKEKTLEFLKRPSLGSWVGLIRILSSPKIGIEDSYWLQKIAEWYKQKKNLANTEALALLNGISGMRYEKRTKTPNAEILNAFVTYRNKQLSHAANLTEEELGKRLPILEDLIAYLLGSAEFLGEMSVFYTERIEVAENDQWLSHISKLAGPSEEPATFLCSEKLDLSELYLVNQDPSHKSSTRPVPLGPFLIWQFNEELKQSEIYFYNDAWRTKLEYLSYVSGSYYFHKELHIGFNDLIKLKIRPGVEEDVHRFLSQDERSDRAEHMFKRALLLAEQGRLEGALELFEHSIEYERRADSFAAMAKVQLELGDPENVILQTIQNCLDIDPNNSEALSLQHATLAADMGVPIENEIKIDERNANVSIKHPTMFQALTPRKLRSYYLWFWVGGIVVWYGVSGLIDIIAHHYIDIIPAILTCIGAVIPPIVGQIGKTMLYGKKMTLSLQLDTMRLDRFDRWFNEQLDFIFGEFVFDGDKLDFAASWRKQRKFYSLPLCFAVSGLIVWLFITGSFGLGLGLLFKRVLDYAIPCFMLLPSARYVLGINLFIYRYSLLSLKPMLTKINDEGLRVFGGFMSINIILGWLTQLTVWTGLLITVQSSFYVDIPFLTVMAILLTVWSIGGPLFIRRAAREAKSKSVHEYAAHIETAFNNFLADPSDEERLAIYDRIIMNQKVIQRIPIWPLSKFETLIVVFGSNLVILIYSYCYLNIRFGQWPPLLTTIRSLVDFG